MQTNMWFSNQDFPFPDPFQHPPAPNTGTISPPPSTGTYTTPIRPPYPAQARPPYPPYYSQPYVGPYSHGGNYKQPPHTVGGATTLLNGFTNEKGELDLQKSMTTVDTMMKTYQQVSPLLRMVTTFLPGK
ncbi:YppG family protein [Salsuginibacillus kocurii]|uniref:YppG family protein n=1 Tax=Salsuginibacillus kocurii TaxID=427078 RepID=UPI00036F8F66|nr:YppG family protein [Salsuginibacillus kocurii]